jgi:hypothetical protein
LHVVGVARFVPLRIPKVGRIRSYGVRRQPFSDDC